MARGPEGLFYSIKHWEFSTRGASNQEILDEFLDYCEFGIPEGNSYRIAKDGSGQMNGVIQWLASYRISEAKFYTTLDPEPMLFVALKEASNPWSAICGFMEFVMPTADNLNATPLTLQPQIRLNSALTRADSHVRRHLENVNFDQGEKLLAALRGEKDKNLDEVIHQLNLTELGQFLEEQKATIEKRNRDL